MFSENLKTLRKQKGFTQEELAARLNIVRQTVSKWEKGLSVPDAELLTRLAEVLEVPVSTLLGSAIPDDKEPDDIARQLARINEQLAVKKPPQPPHMAHGSRSAHSGRCYISAAHRRKYHSI